MKKIFFLSLKSLENFKRELDETHTLIHALEAQMAAAEAVLEFTKAKESPEYEKFRKYLEISEGQMRKLYELGFIALFANFECFMFEILKDLFKRYPGSFAPEKIIKFEDIKHFKKVKDIKDYFIDSVAIEKSYDIESWTDFLHQKFGLNIFKSKKDLIKLKALNSIRNIILHSGSKTNSKFSKEMKGFINSPVPIGEKFNLDMKKYFGILYGTLINLITNFEKN